MGGAIGVIGCRSGTQLFRIGSMNGASHLRKGSREHFTAAAATRSWPGE